MNEEIEAAHRLGGFSKTTQLVVAEDSVHVLCTGLLDGRDMQCNPELKKQLLCSNHLCAGRVSYGMCLWPATVGGFRRTCQGRSPGWGWN
jgi:hypothetical protein